MPRFLFEFRHVDSFHGGVNSLLQTAWEPVTPRGVAAFARASYSRLWFAQFGVALLVAGAVVWLLWGGLYPTVRAAIRQLPEVGEIRDAKLDWRGTSPVLLAEGSFIAFSVDLNHSADIRSPADFQIEFGKEAVLIHSLLGYLDWPYANGWRMVFNRPELEPKWGAWEIPIVGLVALAVILWLYVAWSVLATVYALPLWLVCFFTNRDLTLAGCWRLASAALLPGAIVMAVTILLYYLGVLDLLVLGSVGIGHLVVGWIYLFLSPMFLPRLAETATATNPFAEEKK